jgi:hypothetical protein
MRSPERSAAADRNVILRARARRWLVRKGWVALMDRVVVAVEPDVGLSPGDAGG